MKAPISLTLLLSLASSIHAGDTTTDRVATVVTAPGCAAYPAIPIIVRTGYSLEDAQKNAKPWGERMAAAYRRVRR